MRFSIRNDRAREHLLFRHTKTRDALEQSTIHTEINRAMTRNKINAADAKRWNHLLNMPVKSGKWERDD